MHIDFEGSGGFANLQLNYHVDTDALSKEQMEHLLKLVESSGFFDLQQSDVASEPHGGSPDVFVYRLSMSEGGRQNELTFSDATAPASLQPLLALLQKLALEQRAKRR